MQLFFARTNQITHKKIQNNEYTHKHMSHKRIRRIIERNELDRNNTRRRTMHRRKKEEEGKEEENKSIHSNILKRTQSVHKQSVACFPSLSSSSFVDCVCVYSIASACRFVFASNCIDCASNDLWWIYETSEMGTFYFSCQIMKSSCIFNICQGHENLSNIVCYAR